MAVRRPELIAVTGDVTMDWHVARSSSAGSDGAEWSARDTTRTRGRPGGAALLAEVIAAIADGDVRGPVLPAGPILPDDPRIHHSHAIWAPFPWETGSDEPPAWRVAEFLGLDPRDAGADDRPGIADDAAEARLVVLDDAGLGFRERPEAWPCALADRRRRPWVVLKTARPVAHGTLWERLASDRADRLVVVMTVDDLRRTEVQVSRELSWERTAQDLAWELVYNPQVNALSRAAHVVVSFDTAGAFLLSRGANGATHRRLVFDPEGIEGSWPAAHPGAMIGYTTCLVAGIARALLARPDDPDVEAGVQGGLAAMRALHREGYGRRGATAGEAELAFPVEAVAGAIARDEPLLAATDVQDPVRFLGSAPPGGGRPARPGLWSILEDRYVGRLDSIAPQVAVEGIETALPGVPVGRFGALATVDRQEIESLRAIRSLVVEYVAREESKPLSIAVFGAPGSGKSFGVSQVARSLFPGRIETLTFNLSQLEGPADLHDAFHRVRDRGLEGSIPLVFWDEFDTDGLAWLRHFLAPMQDGTFQEGQVVHPIGRAIFVFAGGTAESVGEFGADRTEEEFRAVKGPDFVSRLKGFVDILGPNSAGGGPDPFHVLRRAILLRALVGKHHPGLFRDDRLRIDPGVLRAFLRTREYRHGARSMESIVATSRLSGRTAFERSSLPPAAQLDLHVDARDFLAHVQRLALEGELLERLAEANHAVYCEGLAARGETTSAAGMAYADLSEEMKEQNRGAVRDIENKLDRAGYVVVPARSDEPPFDFPGEELERLAEMEHDRWMRAKIAAGWRWGEERTADRHPALLLWNGRGDPAATGRFTPEEMDALGPGALPEEEKEKDRDLVRGIPAILARAGCTVLPVGGRSL